MYPILFQINEFSIFGFEIGPLSLFTNGVVSAVGFLIGLYLFFKQAQKNHLHLEFIADHFFSLVIWSLVGARIGYIFVFLSRYRQEPLSMLSVWDGGFLAWAGGVAFLITLFYHCNKQKERIGQWLDALVPAGVVASIFDTIGAFLGGDDYGIATELPWGIAFENPKVPFTIPIHPVQIYLLVALILVLITLRILHKRRLRESVIGLLGLSLFAFSSFVCEYFRGDEMLIYGGHRFTQLLQLAVLIFSLSLLFLSRKQH